MKMFASRFGICVSLLAMATLTIFASCSAFGDEEEFSPTLANPLGRSNSTSGQSSSTDTTSADTLAADTSVTDSAGLPNALADYEKLEWAKVGNSYFISTTEVTQAAYIDVMGSAPAQEYKGDSYPVENVSWFDAVLFCNALSKKLEMDTVYVYESVSEGALNNVEINYSAKGVRLPTEQEWELAYKGKPEYQYYWGTDEASKYAYYAQSKGPAKVATLKPNDYGLYDMAGNVAEWVNDWFGLPDKVDSAFGPESGEYRVIRGGGWNDVVKELAIGSRDKKDPKYKSVTLGFRVVYGLAD